MISKAYIIISKYHFVAVLMLLRSCDVCLWSGDPAVLHHARLQPIKRGGGAQRLSGDHRLHQPASGRGGCHGTGSGQQQRRGGGDQPHGRPIAVKRADLICSEEKDLLFVLHHGCIENHAVSLCCRAKPYFMKNQIPDRTIGKFVLIST